MFKYYSVEDFVRDYGLLEGQLRVLNAGSASTRIGSNCLSVDIQEKPGVDLVADLHELPEQIGEFDAVVCNAVLQYCRNPSKVIDELFRVLKPGGLLFIDAPFVQPYCDDTQDLYRFSEHGLRNLLNDFEIIVSGPSITSGEALSMSAVQVAGDLSSNRYISWGLRKITSALVLPLRLVRTAQPNNTAGAFYVIARKAVVEFPEAPQVSLKKTTQIPTQSPQSWTRLNQKQTTA